MSLTIWLLIATSSAGGYRPPTFTVVERFQTAADCANAIVEIKSQKDSEAAFYFQYRCIPAKVLGK